MMFNLNIIRESHLYDLFFIIICSIFITSFDFYLQSKIDSIAFFILVGTILISFYYYKFHLPKIYSKTLAIYLLLYFLLYMLMVLSFIFFPPQNFSYVLIPFIHLIFLYIVYIWFSKNEQLIFPMLVISLFVALSGILIDVLNPGYFSITEYRAAGYSRNPNSGALSLVVITLGLALYNRAKPLVLFFIIACAFLGMLATGSRGGMMCMVLILLYLLFSLNFKSKIKIFIYLVLIVPFIISFVSFDDKLLNRLAISSQQELIANDSSRLDIIDNYIEEISLSPFGIGKVANDSKIVKAHNSILNISLAFGWFAGIIFLLMLMVKIKVVLYQKSYKNIFILAVFFILVFTQNSLIYKREWLFLTVLILFKYENVKLKEEGNNEKVI
jgi:hypothetical protein